MCRDTVQPRLRHGAQRPATWRRRAATRVAAHDTVRAHDLGVGCVAIQAATRPARPVTRPTISHDTTGHRPTTWLQHGRPGRTAHGLCSQAGFRVCTLCTQPSFDSVHYSESLFGTLFMSIVHEVFKKNKNKKNNKFCC